MFCKKILRVSLAGLYTTYNFGTLRKHFTKHLTNIAARPGTYLEVPFASCLPFYGPGPSQFRWQWRSHSHGHFREIIVTAQGGIGGIRTELIEWVLRRSKLSCICTFDCTYSHIFSRIEEKVRTRWWKHGSPVQTNFEPQCSGVVRITYPSSRSPSYSISSSDLVLLIEVPKFALQSCFIFVPSYVV